MSWVALGVAVLALLFSTLGWRAERQKTAVVRLLGEYGAMPGKDIVAKSKGSVSRGIVYVVLADLVGEGRVEIVKEEDMSIGGRSWKRRYYALNDGPDEARRERGNP